MIVTFHVNTPDEIETQIIISGTVGEMKRILDDLNKVDMGWNSAELAQKIRDVIRQANIQFWAKEEE